MTDVEKVDADLTNAELADHIRRFITSGTHGLTTPRLREIAKRLDNEATRSDEALREALWLFREFVIRNATQWEAGAGHHHPIWVMIAELIGEQGGIVSGPRYR